MRRTASRRLIWPSMQIVPGRRVGVLEIGHEDVGAGIERVDHHLAVDRAGDLDAAIEQILGQRRHRPVGVADALRLGREIGPPAAIELACSAARSARSRRRSPPNRRSSSATKASAAGVSIVS